MKRGVIAWRMVGSAAMSSRDRLTALRAKYSAWTLSLAAVADASSAPASSWNSASMTTMMAIAPSTMMSATPRSRFLRRARSMARFDAASLIVGGSRR